MQPSTSGKSSNTFGDNENGNIVGETPDGLYQDDESDFFKVILSEIEKVNKFFVGWATTLPYYLSTLFSEDVVIYFFIFEVNKLILSITKHVLSLTKFQFFRLEITDVQDSVKF